MSQTASEQHRPIDEIMGELNDANETAKPNEYYRLYAELVAAKAEIARLRIAISDAVNGNYDNANEINACRAFLKQAYWHGVTK